MTFYVDVCESKLDVFQSTVLYKQWAVYEDVTVGQVSKYVTRVRTITLLY